MIVNMFGPSAKRGPGGTPKTNARKIRRHVANAKQGWDEFETLDDQVLAVRYPNALNFYIEPPGCDIRLETMELLAMERLRFLRIIEKFSNMKKDDDHNPYVHNIAARDHALTIRVNFLY